MYPTHLKVFHALIFIGVLFGQVNSARASDINFGFLASFSGPTGSLSSVLADGMQLALSHVNDQGGLHGGKNAVQVRANSRCSDKSKAISAAEQLIGEEAVVGIIGGLCSGTTLAAAQGFTIPTGTPMVTPASTSPAITGLLDNDLLFRTIGVGHRKVEAMALLLEEEATEQLVVVHTANSGTLDQLANLQDLLDGERPFTFATHQLVSDDDETVNNAVDWTSDNNGDLVLLEDPMGKPEMMSYLKRAIALPTVRHVYLSGSPNLEAIIAELGNDHVEKLTLVTTYTTGDGSIEFDGLATRAGLDPKFPFLANTYDAAFILAMAIELTHIDQSMGVSQAIRSVANHPGEKILPGEWGKAVQMIGEGKPVNYEGASGLIEFDDNGDLISFYTKMYVVDGEILRQEIPL